MFKDRLFPIHLKKDVIDISSHSCGWLSGGQVTGAGEEHEGGAAGKHVETKKALQSYHFLKTKPLAVQFKTCLVPAQLLYCQRLINTLTRAPIEDTY